jgi:hypothetical protein
LPGYFTRVLLLTLYKATVCPFLLPTNSFAM